jgi:hypothetical protein
MLTRESEIGRSLSKAHPEDRALLDLSLRRKVKDDVVAAVMRLQPEEVAPRRAAALDRLAAELGIYDDAERARLSDQLAELPADQWPDEPGAPEPVATAPPAGPADTPKETAKSRRRPGAAIAVVVVGALLGGFVGLLLFGGDADDDKDGSAPATAQAPAPEPAAKSVELTALGADFPGHGTARIEGSGTESRLVMSLRDLPPREEAYQVWLYNSLTDALPIDRVVGSTLDIDEVLPVDPAGYKYIDVSREPIDDNPNHSGASVMRVPISELLNASG